MNCSKCYRELDEYHTEWPTGEYFYEHECATHGVVATEACNKKAEEYIAERRP